MVCTPTETFSYKGIVYTPGKLVDGADEVVERYPGLFREALPDGVEQATARPGEKRAARRAKPKNDDTDADAPVVPVVD